MNDSYLDYLTEQFSILGPITIRKMFGGAGIYFNGLMFGLVSDDCVYLKVDSTTQVDFENMGMEPFTYTGKKGTPIKMKYYQLPDDILEDLDELKIWASKAVDVATKHINITKKLPT